MNHELVLTIDNPVVRTHRLMGHHVLPGLAYIDLLYQSIARDGFEYRALELSDLAIHAPLIVEDDGGILLELKWTQSGAGDWRVEAFGRPRKRATTSREKRYAVATMRHTPAAQFDETLDWGSILRSATSTLPLAQIYSASRSHGLVHRGFMKARGSVHVTDDAIYVDCALGRHALRSASSLTFHPALIDGCAVGVTAVFSTMRDPNKHEPAAPLFYRSFRASAPLQRACIARALKSSMRVRNELTYLTLEFFDESLRKVAELQDFASKILPDADLPMTTDAVAGETRPVFVGCPDEPIASAAHAHAHADGDLSGGEVIEFVSRIIAASLPFTAGLATDAGFADAGIGSVELLELAHKLEESLDVALPPTLLFEHTTPRTLAEYLMSEHGGALQRVVRGQVEFPTPVAARTKTSAPTKPEIPEITTQPSGPIAIVGMSGRYPQARDIEELWRNLREGRDCITEVPPQRWDHALYFDARKGEVGRSYGKWGGFIDAVDEFDPLFFQLSPAEACFMDPQQRLFLETTWNLLEGCGYTREALQERHGGRVGVYVGTMYNQYGVVEADLVRDAIGSSPQSAVANRVSHFFGLQGPSIAIDTMCSSAAMAIHLACNDLRQGQCEMAVAGGVNLTLHPKKYLNLSQAEMLSGNPQGRSFGESDGYLPAEAVGAVLLKPLARALSDGDEVWAVIRSTAVNHNGRSNGYSVPNPNAQAQVIQDALSKAGIEAKTISYVEAAASGIELGDAIEMAALTKVFAGTGTRPIGAVKSNMGHAEAASAMAQLAKVLLQFRHAMLAPSIKAGRQNPNIRFDGSGLELQRTLAVWNRPLVSQDGAQREMPRRALINSFGAGGSNVSLVLEEYLAVASPELREDAGPQLIIFSARTESALEALATQLLQFVESHRDAALGDIAYTLQVGREAMERRAAMMVRDRAELVQGMEAFLRKVEPKGSVVVYSGSVEDASRLKEPAASQAAQTLQAALAERDLQKIASLWVRGARVPWNSLRTKGEPRRIALPNYPFERSRYWIADVGAADTTVRAVDAAPAAVSLRTAETRDVTVREFIVDYLSRATLIAAQRIQVHEDFKRYGVDSIVGLRLIRALNARFATQLSGRTLLECTTVEALCMHVEARKQSRPADCVGANNVPGAALRALREFKAGRLTREEIGKQIEEGVFL